MQIIHPEINKQQKRSLFAGTALAGMIVTELDCICVGYFSLNLLGQLAHLTDEDVTFLNSISRVSGLLYVSAFKYSVR
jgi:hypothetical protein